MHAWLRRKTAVQLRHHGYVALHMPSLRSACQLVLSPCSRCLRVDLDQLVCNCAMRLVSTRSSCNLRRRRCSQRPAGNCLLSVSVPGRCCMHLLSCAHSDAKQRLRRRPCAVASVGVAGPKGRRCEQVLYYFDREQQRQGREPGA